MRGQDTGSIYACFPGGMTRRASQPWAWLSSLAHSCSAFVSGICPATFFLVCVWVVGGGDFRQLQQQFATLAAHSKLLGSFGPGPSPEQLNQNL